jgi:hypothetical protein
MENVESKEIKKAGESDKIASTKKDKFFTSVLRPKEMDKALFEIVDVLEKHELSPFEVDILLSFLKMAIVDDFKNGKINFSYMKNDKLGTWKPGYL